MDVRFFVVIGDIDIQYTSFSDVSSRPEILFLFLPILKTREYGEIKAYSDRNPGASENTRAGIMAEQMAPIATD